MRKTFKLQIEGKHPDRVLDAIKHELRKYLTRQRRVPLPAGVDYWDFDCKFGASEENAQVVHLAEVIGRLDAAAKQGAEQCFVEILAKNGHRRARPAGAGTADAANGLLERDAADESGELRP